MKIFVCTVTDLDDQDTFVDFVALDLDEAKAQAYQNYAETCEDDEQPPAFEWLNASNDCCYVKTGCSQINITAMESI